MNSAEIRLVVLDLDGTLYDINDVMSSVYYTQVCFLLSKLDRTKTEIEKWLADNHVYPHVSKNSKSATELFAHAGVKMEEWSEYRNAHFNVGMIQKNKAVNEHTITQIGENRIVVLLSSNTLITVKRILSHLSIPEACFRDILCSDNIPVLQVFNKKEAFEFISVNYGIPFHSILSIGDRYQTDIKPMLELGGCGVLIHSPKSLEIVAKHLNCGMLESGNEYEFYKS